HIGGMLDTQGKPAFPNAVVYAARVESDFWLNPASEEKAPAEFKKYFQTTRNLVAPFVKAGKWKTFENGASPIAGIKAVPIYGHTPGHTAYEVSNGKESLLITGDMVHFMAVQFTHPEVSVGFDTNQKEAIANRTAIFKSVAEHKSLIAGMHLPFPGIGHIRAESKNSYTYMPIEYSPIQGSVKAKSN
ncbi:MAG: MBL fold metallo-hydrolase, partial [Smithella sp.]